MNNLKPIWAEIRCDYIDETDRFWRVDAWTTGDGNEEGSVIAHIDDLTGRVVYADPRARYDNNAQEVIKEKVNEIKTAYDNLVKKIETVRSNRNDETHSSANITLIDFNMFTFVYKGKTIVAVTKEPVPMYDTRRSSIVANVYQAFVGNPSMTVKDIEYQIAKAFDESGITLTSITESPAITIEEEPIARKTWCREDVASILRQNECEGTEKEIDEVINTGMLSALEDCTDEDWQIIDDAVRYAIKTGNIVPKTED